jgi:ABC-type transporter lipoprotein component MlaA
MPTSPLTEHQRLLTNETTTKATAPWKPPGRLPLNTNGGLLVDYTAESQINFLNVSEVSSNHPEIWALRAVDKRYQTSFRYGQMNSPFEYEKVRYIYTESRKLQIAE